jgi:hypothetical protein
MTFGEKREFSVIDELELGADVVAAIREQDSRERFQAVVEAAGDLAIRAA